MKHPNSAPAYYQGRPASLWINVMKPCRRPTGGCPAAKPSQDKTSTDLLSREASHD